MGKFLAGLAVGGIGVGLAALAFIGERDELHKVEMTAMSNLFDIQNALYRKALEVKKSTRNKEEKVVDFKK